MPLELNRNAVDPLVDLQHQPATQNILTAINRQIPDQADQIVDEKAAPAMPADVCLIDYKIRRAKVKHTIALGCSETFGSGDRCRTHCVRKIFTCKDVTCL